ncbi:MAG: hypothetical protein V4511_15875 [Bacteroidota bacterium]
MKHSIFYLWLMLLVTFCYLQSCTYDKGDLPIPIKTAPYQTAIKPILITYCYGQGTQTCHVTVSNQGAPGDFTTYAGIKAKVDNGTIQSRVLTSGGGMPPTYSSGPTALSSEDLEKLKTWVNNGAQDN